LGVLLLSILQGPDKGRSYQLPDHEPQLIGRSSEAIRTTDNAISRRHAELTPDDGVWYLRDLESQNGTYVNGTRIEGRVRLRAGDQIRIGQTLFVFGEREAKAPDSVRIVGGSVMDTSIERSLRLGDSIPGLSFSGFTLGNENDDSIVLSEPEPRAAADHHLKIIYRLTTLLSRSVMDRDSLLNGVMDLVFAEFKPDRAALILLESPVTLGQAGTGTEGGLPAVTELVRFRNTPTDEDEARIHISRTILQHAVHKGEGVLSTNAMNDPRFAKGDSVQRFHIRSAVCSPIRFRETTYGALYIDSSIAKFSFTAEQLALLNAVGQHTGLALANADLYQQKLQSQRLATIGETVATLSHSIKNILQGLRGGADLVELGLRKGDSKLANGGWPILKRNLDRIISLTMNMLAFSRQRTVELELTPLGPILEDAGQLLESLCAQRGVALIVDADPELPPVPLDASLIHQAILNIMTNAVEAVPATKGVVTVRASYRPGGVGGAAGNRPAVVVAVIDNGPGIPVSKQPWVFEPFNTTKGVRGTGLGLAVAKRIVEEHHGTLLLTSAENKGATFTMMLPADLPTAHDPSATHSPR
jgi:signal transduction histidine kinase